MPTAIGTTEVTINDGQPMPGRFEIETEVTTYRSATATKPLMSWTEIDANGHFHAYDRNGELPTLIPRTVHVECDGFPDTVGHDEDCDGFDATEYHCVICDLLIEPKRVPDTGEKVMPGRKSWYAEINPEREIKGKVTVRVKHGDQVFFGVAHARTTSMEGDDRGIRITTRLDGIGPLGERRG